MTSTLGIALPLVCALVLIVFLPRREVPSHTLSLLRCFFPAWRFFEEIAPSPRLHHRLAVRDARATGIALHSRLPNGGELGPWVPSLTAPKRGSVSLWLNAAGNLHLAEQSLVERLYDDLEEERADVLGVTQSVSYQLVQALVADRIRAAMPQEALQLGAACEYQFRLSAADDPDATLFVSELHTL